MVKGICHMSGSGEVAECAGPRRPRLCPAECTLAHVHTHTHMHRQQGPTGFPPISGSRPPLLSKTAYSSLRPILSS